MKTADPRVTRTRKLILGAFVDLLTEKPFQAVTVQDIAERATVNRATFYAHFDDKYALLDYLVRERFREAMAARHLVGLPYDEENFRLFIQAVLEFVGQFMGSCRHADRTTEPAIEKSIEEEIAAFLGDWFKGFPAAPQVRLAPDAAAAILSWTIFGAGVEWSRSGDQASAADWADRVLCLLMNGLSGVHRPLATAASSA